MDSNGECPVESDGDCFSETNRAILAESDIVVTNPPFSLFRGYMEMMMDWGGEFCVVGDLNATKYRDIFPLFLQGRIWLGASMQSGAWFDSVEVARCATTTVRRNGKDKLERWNGRARWVTNMDYKRRHNPLILRKRMSAVEYPRYDNFDAIEVDLVAKIPSDYGDVMGVPITYLDRHCPEQFEIIGKLSNGKVKDDSVYERILIRNLNPEPTRRAA